MNRLKQNPNTGAEDTGSKHRPDSTGSEEPQGNNAIVETRCDVTRNPAKNSNYFLQGAVALALLSLALNVGLFQSLMAIRTDMAANQIQMESLRRDIHARFDMIANQIQIENLRRDILNQKEGSKNDMTANQIQIENLRRDVLNQDDGSKKATEDKLKPTSGYSPNEENEAKLNDLHWIRNLITDQSSTYLQDEAANLSNWLLRLQNAENMLESNGSLKSLESQEKELSELMDEPQLFSFAKVLNDKAKYTEALGLFQKIFKRRIVSLGSEHFDTLSAQHRVAMCLGRLGEYSKALNLYRFVYQKWSQTLGPDHENTLIAQHNIALMLHKESKYADALRIYENVLQKEISTLGENHASTQKTKSNIANTRLELGMT